MQREWTTGSCWLYCERDNVPVLWLGPVQEDGCTAHLFACRDCVARLRAKLWRYVDAKGQGPSGASAAIHPTPVAPPVRAW